MKKAILFDLDGTLWDSSKEVALSWSKALEPYGLQISQADVQSVMGKTTEEIAALLLPRHTLRQRQEILMRCSEEELRYLSLHSASPYPALEETVAALSQEYTLCIVSNCQEGYIETFLQCTGLTPYFLDMECAGRTGRPKGENIRLVLERNDLSPAIYVGDTQKDLDAARMAGIPFVHAAYGFGRVDDPSLPAIRSLAELPALAATLL